MAFSTADLAYLHLSLRSDWQYLCFGLFHINGGLPNYNISTGTDVGSSRTSTTREPHHLASLHDWPKTAISLPTFWHLTVCKCSLVYRFVNGTLLISGLAISGGTLAGNHFPCLLLCLLILFPVSPPSASLEIFTLRPSTTTLTTTAITVWVLQKSCTRFLSMKFSSKPIHQS